MIPLDPPSLIEAPDTLETERLLLRQILETDVDCGGHIVRRDKRCAGIKTGLELGMRETYTEGVATHGGPEPCATVRKDRGEALDRGRCRLGD